MKVLPDPEKQADLLMSQVEKDVEAALQNVSVYSRTTLVCQDSIMHYPNDPSTEENPKKKRT